MNEAADMPTLPVRGESRCDVSFPPAPQSPYILPYQVGNTFKMFQGICPPQVGYGHQGWIAYDFDLATGDTIVASRAGRVLFVQESFEDATRVCGEENFIFIEHTDGTMLFYVHMTKDGVLVSPGETVEQGQPIGLSGDTGCSSGPHLHMALFKDRSHTGRDSSQPLNFSNADGPLDERNRLVQGASYTALPY